MKAILIYIIIIAVIGLLSGVSGSKAIAIAKSHQIEDF